MRPNDAESDVLKRLLASQGSSEVIHTTLTTDQRVIARVTDGIYREPASALRELISNAYDADATLVTIRTDAPRFDRIVVEDNGQGMSPKALTRMIHHIGGSAKRTKLGGELGITDNGNPTLTPRGRKIIGKIGIGLFSVSQMTQSFQIVTKIKGDDYSTVAAITLKQYSDATGEGSEDDAYEAGKVNIWREPSPNPKSHGTSIILTGIRPATRKILKSSDLWNLIDNPDEDTPATQSRKPPTYYVGRLDPQGESYLGEDTKRMRLPWAENDSPYAAFDKMVDAVWSDIGKTSANPTLSSVFDYYLRMIWELALAVPLPYVAGHPFDQSTDDWANVYRLSNEVKGSPLKLGDGDIIRESLSLTDASEKLDFEVVIDGVSLRRPVKFRGLPTTGHALKKPLVFVGKCRHEFNNVPVEFSGGPLEFEAYLFWTPKIAPTEHRGSLVRIHGASGTLFDNTFMDYQVAEISRLKQITCEIFVSKGLESALNIDRESFNTAHPHVIFLTRWLHSALRQLTNTQKSLARKERERLRSETSTRSSSILSQIVQKVWDAESGESGSRVPVIEFIESAVDGGKQTFDSDLAFLVSSARRDGGHPYNKAHNQKLEAIIQLLAAFDVFELLDQERSQRLFDAIAEVMSFDA